MEEQISTGLTANRRGRRFGFTIGAAFLVLAVLLAWRGHPAGAGGTGALGLVLFLAGLLVPARLLPVERGWMRTAQAMSKVTTPIILGIVYFLVVTPIGFIVRRTKGNPLVHGEVDGGFWIPRNRDRSTRGGMDRQF